MAILSCARVRVSLAVCALAFPAILPAQQAPGLGGIGFRAGTVTPDNAKRGFGVSGEIDLGYVRSPHLRALVGLGYFSADVDRRIAGRDVGGSMTSVGGRVGVRLDVLPAVRFSPYVGVALSGHSVSADVTDAGTRQLLDGFYVGAGISGGVAFALDSARRFAATAEARRVFVTNVAHTAYEVGFRFSPRGPAMYSNVAAEERRRARKAEARLAEERERERHTVERASARRD